MKKFDQGGLLQNTGYAMMKTNMSFFHMRETVVAEIIGGLPYAVFIRAKNIQDIGRTATNAGMVSKLKCTFGTAPTNMILTNWKNLRRMN